MKLFIRNDCWQLILPLVLSVIVTSTVYAQNSFDVGAWLDENEHVKMHINWETSPDQFLNYEAWDTEMKADLDSTIKKVILLQDLGIQDQPELYIKPNPGEIAATTLYPEEAWRIYLAHIAQSIVVDAYNYVSWNLLDASERKLHHLFDGQSFYVCMPGYYEVVYKHGVATLGDPLFVFSFLKRNNLIGFNERNTIERILDWGREYLHHYSRGPEETYEQSYLRSFDGFQGDSPPIKTVINGVFDTTYYNDNTYIQHYHFSKGCHGTTGFLKGVCRIINIEVSDIFTVLPDYASGHSQPVFPGINAFMGHGDDVYAGASKTYPRLDISKILFDLDLFTEIYDSTNYRKTLRYKSIYFLDYLPIDIILNYCRYEKDMISLYDHYGLNAFYEGIELDSLGSLLKIQLDSIIIETGDCNTNEYFVHYWERYTPPFHNVYKDADILSVSLNMPIIEKSIDVNNQKISLRIQNDNIPDSLVLNTICSEWASIEQINGNKLEVNQPNYYKVTSEDELTVNIWEIVIAHPVQVVMNNDVVNDLLIMPNPNNGSFICKVRSKNLNEIVLKLINPLGQVIEQKNVILTGTSHEEYFDISHLGNGIYILTCSSGSFRKSEKIVLQ